MKQIFLPKSHAEGERCDEANCSKCRNCKVAEVEVKKTDVRTIYQLYAKEAEHYFFYYNLNMMPGS